MFFKKGKRKSSLSHITMCIDVSETPFNRQLNYVSMRLKNITENPRQ